MPDKPEKPKVKRRKGLFKPDGYEYYQFQIRFRGERFQGTTKCKSFKDAFEWLEAEKMRINLRMQERLEPPVPTFQELWEAWEVCKGPIVSSTHKRYMKGVVSQHLYEWRDKPVTALTTAAVEELRNRYLNSEGRGFKRAKQHLEEGEKTYAVRKHSEGGWNKVLTQIKALVGWGIETERLRIKELPFKAKKIDVSPFAKSVLWPEQVQKFLAAVDTVRKEREGDPFPHSGIAIRLMLGLGLRENEALHLEWDRIDWRRSVAIIARSVATGKKIKSRKLYEIPLPNWLKDYLLIWWTHCGHPVEGLLLVARNGKAHVEGSTGKAVAKGGKALGIKLTPHSLRRTFATGAWELGTPLTQIQQMMGHSTPDITMKHYIVQRPKEQAEALEKLGDAMGFYS